MNDKSIYSDMDQARQSAVKIIMRHHARLWHSTPVSPWLGERGLKRYARQSWTCLTLVNRIIHDEQPPLDVLDIFYCYLERRYNEDCNTELKSVWGDCMSCLDDIEQLLGEGGI